ncbi:MAG: tetratricopeptide repeat protein [Pyrinomonadaceae bacterium]|nr:tetratricopeptide repeat protein [Pyrinomonadaceae bacterium]
MLRRRRIAYAVTALLALSALLFAGEHGAAAQARVNNDVVLVLPFENTTNHAQFNWVGESFADSLSELLNVPGLVVVSSDERELAYQKLRLPLTTLPSRATAIKLAREAKATMVILGTYSIIPGQGESPASLTGTARVIKVNEGRVMGETMPGGVWATREFDFGGALTRLQEMQGRLAYQVLYQRDKALPFSQNQFVQQATKIPPKAFEAYIKGVQTDDEETRAIYLKNAIKLYSDANAGAIYPQAAFELGHLYLKKQDWKGAAEYFSRIQKREPHYAESAFYSGYAFWRMGDLTRALSSLVPLTTDMPLTAVYNNAGAISVQAARDEKKPEERARLLNQGLTFLSRASQSSPGDTMVRFNYAYGLFLAGKYSEAADQLRPVIAGDPRDGYAYFLFAKSLERIGKAGDAADADNQARRYLQVYAKWQTEWQKSQTVAEVPLRLRQVYDREGQFTIRADQGDDVASGNTQDLLIKARELYSAGRDEEALPELRRVLMIEPMNAEAYLLIGRIHLRRGDQEQAISALKTAIFWDAKLIDAHVLLGRIFLERGDRAAAMTYARNAMQIDPNNQEAIALQRQVDTGGK